MQEKFSSEVQQEEQESKDSSPKNDTKATTSRKKLEDRIDKLEKELKLLESRREMLKTLIKATKKTGKDLPEKPTEDLKKIVKKIEAKQQELSTARQLLALALMEKDQREFRKFVQTSAGQRTLVEIYIRKCLQADPGYGGCICRSRKVSELDLSETQRRIGRIRFDRRFKGW